MDVKKVGNVDHQKYVEKNLEIALEFYLLEVPRAFLKNFLQKVFRVKFFQTAENNRYRFEQLFLEPQKKRVHRFHKCNLPS
jgi:hypothetical protein